MLVVFHLGWDRFNIDQKVAAANRKISGIARDKQADHLMIFNLASLGAGEIIIDRQERIENARKSDPDFDSKLKALGVDDVSYERPPARAIDYIRRRHWRIARDLGHDNQFKAYRDAAEMLLTLRTRGHQLAAVFTGASLKPMALAGYLDPYLDNAAIDLKLAEMRQAGAAYAVVGGHGISSLPDFLFGRRQLKSTIDTVNKKLGL